MKSKTHTTSPLATALSTLLLFLLVVYVTADTYFGVTPLLFGENSLPNAGYVGEPSPESVQVPDFVGSKYNQTALTNTPLFTYEVTYVYHPTAPPATVLEQSPTGGSFRKVTEGDPCHVSLVVSMGKAQAVIPDLEGMDVREAEIALGQLGLIPKLMYVPSNHTHDRVLATKPQANTLVDVGQIVILEVSKTSPDIPLPCPDLVGLTLDEAYLALSSAGLTLGEIQIQDVPPLDPWGIRTDDTPPRILSQDHMAGSYLPKGYKIGVIINHP